jgi:hypothetical protein
MGEVHEAIKCHEERKNAVLGKEFEDNPIGIETSEKDPLKLMLSGFDLDDREVLEESMRAAEAAVMALASGMNPVFILKGLWIDGLITALWVAKNKEDL